ncbi:hypothetical protein Scep_021513 [Stephania cephalantha]|uniref:Uncharacterized protein n=1 Tax=Stephania cephalantha TaxID=152367 RepID=A0AAP0I1X9_9MAGN
MKKKIVHLQVVVSDQTLISCRLVHLLKRSGSSPPCIPSQSTKTYLSEPPLSVPNLQLAPLSLVSASSPSFLLSLLSSRESGFDSIGHYVAATGRVLGEFGFNFFDHSSLIDFGISKGFKDLKIESHEIE